MSLWFLLPALLVPVLLGLTALWIPFRSTHSLHTYVECAALVTTALVWILLLAAPSGNVTVYTFVPGFPIQLGLDGAGRLYAGLVSLMWPIVQLYAFAYMEHDSRERSFFAFYLMTYGATLGICFSSNMLTMFIFYEMLSLSTLPLVAHNQDHDSMYAARIYAGFLMGGAALALGAVITGTLYSTAGGIFSYGGSLLADIPADRMRVIYLLGFFGFGMKAAVFPFHYWLPTASVAPTPVTALLHAVAVVNTGVFAVMRLTWYSFGPDLLRGTWVQTVCLLFAAFTLIYAAAVAVRERHVKRRLAYSTVSNLSYMLFGILLLTPDGLTAGLSHMISHSLMKITLFLCIGSFMHHTGRAYLYEINGVGKYMPFTFTFYTISACSLLGIPSLGGFVSKWHLLTAGASEGSFAAWIGVGCLIASAFLCAIYGLSVSVRAFFPIGGKDLYEGKPRCREGGWRMLVPMGIFTACQFVIGLHPEPLLDFLTKISEGLL